MTDIVRSRTPFADGSYGRVYVGSIAGTPCAIKQPIVEEEDRPFDAAIIRELNTCAILRHPFIHCATRFVVVGAELKYYLMSDLRIGSLHRLCRDRFEKGVPAKLLRRMAYQLISATAHMREHGIMHRDIKPDNVLVDSALNVFLTDFGSTRPVYSTAPISMSTPICTCLSRPIEDFLGINSDGGFDDFSTGMTLLIAVHGAYRLFCTASGDNMERVDAAIKDKKYPKEEDAKYLHGMLVRLYFPSPEEWPEVWVRLHHMYPIIAADLAKKIAKRPVGVSRERLRVGLLRRLLRRRRDLPASFFEMLAAMLDPDPAHRLSAHDALRHEYFTSSPIEMDLDPAEFIGDKPLTPQSIKGRVSIVTDPSRILVDTALGGDDVVPAITADTNILASHPGLTRSVLRAVYNSLVAIVINKVPMSGNACLAGIETTERYLMRQTTQIGLVDLRGLVLAALYLAYLHIDNNKVSMPEFVAHTKTTGAEIACDEVLSQVWKIITCLRGCTLAAPGSSRFAPLIQFVTKATDVSPRHGRAALACAVFCGAWPALAPVADIMPIYSAVSKDLAPIISDTHAFAAWKTVRTELRGGLISMADRVGLYV